MNRQVEFGKRAFALLKIDQEILSRRNKEPVTFRRRNLNAEMSQGYKQITHRRSYTGTQNDGFKTGKDRGKSPGTFTLFLSLIHI